MWRAQELKAQVHARPALEQPAGGGARVYQMSMQTDAEKERGTGETRSLATETSKI